MPSILSKSCAILAKSERKPYSPELADFIKRSREIQTLYANCEGVYKRRVFPSNGKELLENYLTAAMYFEKCIDESKNLSEDERRKVSAYADKIIDESQKYNLGEIHMNVVWIYVFQQVGNSSSSLPLFKIFKDKTTECAVFLDSFFNTYPSWNSLLDHLDLEESLLCVPRNGAYSFQEDQLQLDYLLSRGLRKISAADNQVRPFSEVSIRPWIKSLSDELLRVGEETLQFVIKNKNLIILVVSVLLKLIGAIGTGCISKIAMTLSMMLFNTIQHEGSVPIEGINGVARPMENSQNFLGENAICTPQRESETKSDPFSKIDKSDSPFLKNLENILQAFSNSKF